jgi:anaerobic selenocysteine-containing dehydrogenase
MVRAIQQMEMYVWAGWHLTAEAKVADIVLPLADFFECEGGFSGLNETIGIAQCPQLLQPRGQAMPLAWAQAEIANRLGFGQYWNALYGPNGTAAQWPAVDQKALANGFNNWNSSSTAAAWGVKSLPSSLSTLQSQGFLYAPSQTVTTGNSTNVGVLLKQAIDSGNETMGGVQGKPFWTPSGLAEFYCNWFASPNLSSSTFGGPIDPMPVYRVQPYGMLDKTTALPQYPLMLYDTHPRARSNVASMDSNPLAGQSEVFRHSVWMSVADAQARGISDNDKVKVFNEQGTIVLPAYVTSRIVPGVTWIPAGAWYNPDENGVDHRGNDVVLMHQDYNPVHEPFNTRVEIALYTGGVEA